MNNEEAINGLKEDIYNLKDFLTDTEKEKWQQAIDTVLNYIEELEEKIKVCTDTGAKLINTKFIKNNFIPKQKIRDKIEELKEQFRDYDAKWTKTLRDKKHPFYKYLIRIEAEIDILEELLEEEK